MASTKLSSLPAGSAIVDADLFYSAPFAGSQVKQAASALRVYAAASNQRSVTASPIVVASGDQIINCNIASGSPTCALPLASTRSGLPLIFKDVGGQFSANNLTLTPTSPDTIDGMTTFVLRDNYSGVTLVPLNDGVNSGWSTG